VVKCGGRIGFWFRQQVRRAERIVPEEQCPSDSGRLMVRVGVLRQNAWDLEE